MKDRKDEQKNASLTLELTEEGRNLERIKGLSDGVFSIVLTLLVLDLRFDRKDIPDNANESVLLQHLLELFPIFVGYIVSFFVIGTYWIVHNRMFRHVVKYDRRILWLNLGLLFFITLLPFSTMLVTSYDWLAASWTLYAANVACVGLMSVAIWRVAVALDGLDEHMDPKVIDYMTARGYVVPAVFLLSIPLAFVHVLWAQLSPLLVIVAMRLLTTWFTSKAPKYAPKPR